MPFIIILIAFVIMPFKAFALNLKGYQFSDSYRFSVLKDALHEKFDGPYVITGSAAYMKSPLYVSDANVTTNQGDIISYAYVATFGMSYYINPALLVGFDLNAIHNKVLGEGKTSFGDMTLKGTWAFLRQNNYSLALSSSLHLPTGDTENFSSIDSMGGEVNVIGEYHFGEKWHLLASLGYFHGKNNEFDIIDYRNLILTQLGVSYDLTQNWNLNLESVRNFPTERGNRQDEGEYYLTMKNKTTETISIYFGTGVAGVEELDRKNYTIFAGLKFSEK